MDYHGFLSSFPRTYVGRGPADRPDVCLTFDDGPGDATPALLATLRQLEVKATFFCLGDAARRHPDQIRAIVADGHDLGSHGLSHLDLRQLSSEAFGHDQVIPSIRVIEDIAGQSVRLFRPPYGEISAPQVQWLEDAGYTLVGWSIDPQDWADPMATGHVDRVVGEVLRHVHPGAIVLLHDGDDDDVDRRSISDVVEGLVSPLRKKGFHFTGVEDMLERRIPAP